MKSWWRQSRLGVIFSENIFNTPHTTPLVFNIPRFYILLYPGFIFYYTPVLYFIIPRFYILLYPGFIFYYTPVLHFIIPRFYILLYPGFIFYYTPVLYFIIPRFYILLYPGEETSHVWTGPRHVAIQQVEPSFISYLWYHSRVSFIS